MTKPMIHEFNAETQENILREMNDVEYEQYLADVVLSEQRAAERAKVNAAEEAKKAAKAQALAALGLSQEIVNILAE
jgi:hypothetical protein